MCECGCISNDKKYRFPAPGDSFYVLTLSVPCVNCDAPPGITIERIDPSSPMFDLYKRGEYLDGKLRFEKWPDTLGVAIVTGMRKQEFIGALMQHLVGVDSNELGEDGKLDESGVEVILEDMYEDSQIQPNLLKPVRR